MANIKNLNTILKALNDTPDETLAAIINNEAVDVEAMSAKDKLCTLVFEALAKGINTKTYELVLDCNFPASKFHNHEDEGEDEYKVDYYRVVPTAAPSVSLIQIYAKPTRKADGIRFGIATSSKKYIREKIEAADELGFYVKRNGVTGATKGSCKEDVQYDELVPLIKNLLVILAEANKEHEAEKAKKKTEKAEEKKEMTVEDMVNTIAEVLSEDVA